MNNTACPYCGEEIRANAMVCRYCHSNIYRTREDRLVAAVIEHVMLMYGSSFVKPSGSRCEAWCHGEHKDNEAALKRCLRDCKAEEAYRLVAEKLHRELDKTFIEIIWSGGDIDPLEFEKLVRERFSRPRGK